MKPSSSGSFLEPVYFSYFSIAVVTHHGHGNLKKKFSWAHGSMTVEGGVRARGQLAGTAA